MTDELEGQGDLLDEPQDVQEEGLQQAPEDAGAEPLQAEETNGEVAAEIDEAPPVEEPTPEPELPAMPSKAELLEMQLQNEREMREAAERDRDRWQRNHQNVSERNRDMGRRLSDLQRGGPSYEPDFSRQQPPHDPFYSNEEDQQQGAPQQQPHDYPQQQQGDPRYEALMRNESQRIIQEEGSNFEQRFPVVQQHRQEIVEYFNKNRGRIDSELASLDPDRVRRATRTILTEAVLAMMTAKAPEIEAASRSQRDTLKEKKRLASPASSGPSRPRRAQRPLDPSTLDLSDPEQRKRALEIARKQLAEDGRDGFK